MHDWVGIVMDLMTRSWLNSASLLVVGAVLTYLMQRIWRQRDDARAEAKRLADEVKAAKHVADDERRQTDKRVAELEQQLIAVKETVLSVNAVFQAILVKELTHYHTPRMDELLKKLGPPITLSLEEQIELSEGLERRTTDLNGRISDSERDAAAMLPMVMKRVLAESVANDPVKLGIVTTPVKATEKK